MTSISEKLRQTYSGIFGNQVLLRGRKKSTVLTIEPVKAVKVYTAEQERVKNRFRNAAAYAKEILKDPDMLALYQAKARDRKTPYTIAVTDYLRVPKIMEIDTSHYTGAVGDAVTVTATDDVTVMKVEVIITGSDGLVVEQGLCTRNQFGTFWTYTATTAVEVTEGITITAVAFDIPGNRGTGTVSL